MSEPTGRGVARIKPALRRTVGTAAGSTLALALLACGCVFAALAGPALSLHTRSQALHQTLAGFPNTTKTVQVNGSWADFVASLPGGQNLDRDTLAQATSQIALGLASAPLPLAAGDWADLNTNPLRITAGAAASAQAGAPPKLEVVYRDPFTSHAQLVAGSYASGSVPPGAVAVAATVPTAARFGLRPGSHLTLATPSGPAALVVTAIVRARDGGSTFWRQDTTVARPSLEHRPWRRPVAEVTAIAASVGGLIVLHDQGMPASGGGGLRVGADLYLTAVPVLVALPVVVVMLRLYPLAIRGLLALSARGAGATGFVALARAATSSLTGALPAFALVLSLSLATFAGMVSQGIIRGEVAASWHATGADVLVQPGPGSGPVTADAVKAISAVPGVRHAAAVWNTNWSTPFGQPVTVVAVDPAGYAAVVAGTPFPAFPAARIGTAPSTPSTAPVPVLASPSAAAVLGTKAIRLSTVSATGPLRVRVAGIMSDTPAQPGGGAFVVVPLAALPGPAGQAAPNMLLVTGSAINDTRLTAVANRVIPGNIITFRSAVLTSLASSPLQRGAGLIITLTIAAAAALGLFIVILALALGSAERGLTLARLTVMGHERAAGLVMAEAMPAVLAAVVAGMACAVTLPRVVGSAIDLSAFTGTSAPVRLQPDALALGLPAAVIAVLALAALAAEARALRRRDVSGMLRAH